MLNTPSPALLDTLSRKRARGELPQPTPLVSPTYEDGKNSHNLPPLPQAGEGWGEGQ